MTVSSLSVAAMCAVEAEGNAAVTELSFHHLSKDTDSCKSSTLRLQVQDCVCVSVCELDDGHICLLWQPRQTGERK